MTKAIIAGLVLLGSLLAPAATVVDLNLNLSADVNPARPIDVNTTSNQTYNWSSSSLLFNGPVTTGNQNTKIYGAFSAQGSTGTLANATVKLDEATPDTILFRCDKLPGITNSTADLRAVAFWDATNFLAFGSTRFDASPNSSLTIGVGSWLNAIGISGIRYVIRDRTNYYVSSVNGPTAQSTTDTIYGNTPGLQWAAFDINNWATYSEADANLGLGTLSFSARTFNNVTGVGLLGAATRSSGNPPILSVSDFQASLVPPLTNSFTLTVTGGSGGGLYTNGQQVAIAAYNTPWQTFVRWTGDTQYVASVNSSNTTVTMPAKDIALDVTFSYFTPSNWPDMYVPRYNEKGTNYAPYPLVANGTLNTSLSTNELTSMAKNFDCLYCVGSSFTKANANYVYGLNTNFQIVAYINESHSASMFGYTEPWEIEKSNKTDVLYYLAGNLGVALPATTNRATFAVSNLFSTLVASTAAADSNVTYKVGSTYYFVTWLKMDGELMRIDSATNDTVHDVATVTVTRAFSGTTAAAHTNNTPVFVPVCFKSGPIAGTTTRIEYYGDPGAPLMAQDRLAFAMNQNTNYNRGIWEDIYGATLNALAMGGEPLDLNSGRFWNFRKNQIYTAGEFIDCYEEGVNSNQTNFYARYGKQLVFWGNNIGSPTDFANYPKVAALQSTPFKPRPLDGYAQENGIAAYADGTKDFGFSSYSQWSARVQSTMFLGENKLAALYVIMDAGADNATFSALPDSTRHALFLYGYASYLLAVKVETNDLIYTKFAFTPLVGTNSATGYYQLDPIFLYPIGRPTETRASTNYSSYCLPGLTTFRRQFENGLVLANPGDDTNVTDVVALSRPYFDPEVGLTVTQVLMTAKSGRILLTPSNSAPVFTMKPISRPNASAGVVYSNTLAGAATDADAGDTLTYSRLSGPGWLNVATNGTLSGLPGAGDVGTNVFTVKVADAALASDSATLNIVVQSAYTYWANQYQLVQGPYGNDDGDTFNNLYEFGLGGNPTNSSDLGYPITYRLNAAGGTNWFEYVHPQRSDPNSGLLYSLEISTNLAAPVWTNSGYTVVGSGPLANGFLSVTNRIETNVKSQQFIRLKIEGL